MTYNIQKENKKRYNCKRLDPPLSMNEVSGSSIKANTYNWNNTYYFEQLSF